MIRIFHLNVKEGASVKWPTEVVITWTVSRILLMLKVTDL